MLDRVAVDFVSAMRSLRTAPAIPVAAVVTTALAVAINLGMASLIDRALLSPPAHVADPARVFTLGFEATAAGGTTSVNAPTSYLMLEAIRDRVPDLAVAGWNSVATTSILVDNNRVAIKANGATADYFAMLGVSAHLGRTLAAEDDRPPAGAPVAVLSHSFWRRGFGGDPNVIGRRLQFGSETLQVIGVMPAGFSGHTAERVDLWVPLSTAMRDQPGWHRTPTMATVAVGVRLPETVSKAAAEDRLAAASGTRVVLWPIIGADVAPEPHRIAWWLTAVSLIVLVAGLANAATLCLARGARRRRELTIRAAMGATRARLFRQLLFEFAIVSLASTIVALLLGFWFDELIRRVLFPALVERSVTGALIIAAAVIGGASTFIVGTAASAFTLPSAISPEDLNGRRRTWRRSGVQRELLVLQTTLAVMLLTGAGMFAQSYQTMAAQNPAAQLDDVLVVSFDDGPGSVRDQDQVLATAVDRLRKLPGVESATVFGALPFRGIHVPPIVIPGISARRLDGARLSMIEATPELFTIFRIDIVRGRAFTSANDRGAPVVIVSESMARAIWPGANAIGKCVRIGWPPASAVCREVIGVARDWRRASAALPDGRRTMHYYVPFAQGLQLPPSMVQGPMADGIAIRKDPDIAPGAGAIRNAVTGGTPGLPFVDVRPYLSVDGPRLSHWVIGMQLLLLFGALALATTALGLYAAFAHAVTERRLEMAIRLAMGASRQRVLLMLLREGMALTAKGAVNGFIVAALVGWAARSMIVGLSSPGPLVMAAAAVVVLTMAVMATWLPALAASRAEPNALLKVD